MNKQGAIWGMVVGISLMLFYMIRFKTGLFLIMDPRPSNEWWFGISPEGFGSIAMLVNIIISIVVSRCTSAPPEHIQELVEKIRIPNEADKPSDH